MKHVLRNTAASYNTCVHAKMAEFTHRSFYPSRDRDRRAVLGSGTAQYTQDFHLGRAVRLQLVMVYYAGSFLPLRCVALQELHTCRHL